ncbi:hypothetical protein FOL47_008198 [Perkinsus chesapeaki]|uniref:Uncharacterized protein n=1 Tax=Perkinsus chesapeaki TaxID=330153 RepID=A0A7J6LGR6_PERCH|nr:hypothetical protein FOL47_008198 [Perkinsus chesapeaki]
MSNSSNLNTLLRMVVLLCMLWSIECQAGSYSGYTDKKQQCIQVDWHYEPMQVMQVVVSVHCGDTAVGSPYLKVIKIYPNYPYTVSKASEKDRAGFMSNLYQTCKLMFSPPFRNDLNTFFYDDHYTEIRVEFRDEIVNLTRGEC